MRFGGVRFGGVWAASGNPSKDRLAAILARGTLVLPTDPAYPPASFAVDGGTRAPDTKCAENQLTGPEVDGYDVAVGKAVAEALGLEPCFVTPAWTELISGNVADRWDIEFSSIGITPDRMDALYFTQPYYATPERFFVARSSDYQQMAQLDGKRVGVCTGCFADLYLRKQLVIPGEEVKYRVDDAVIVGYDSEPNGLDDVGTGKIDAFLCQETAGNQAISEGVKLRPLEPAAYVAYIGGALDRSSGTSQTAFFDRVNQILGTLHGNGTLVALSKKYFGKDYATLASEFDLSSLGQTVT